MTAWGHDIVNKQPGPWDHDPVDYQWWVYSKDLKMAVPLPPGKVPILADDEPYDEDGIPGNPF